MAKTRGVFALITEGKMLLLSERADGKGWNLPGGRVEEGEDDQAALVREVKEETGLEVEVLHQVGPEHVFNDDTAVAYACRVTGGKLQTTAEAKNHYYATEQEVRRGYYEREEDPVKIPLKLIGPEGRLGRTGRMVWDAFSLMLNPIKDSLPFDEPHFIGIGIEDMAVGVLTVIGNCFYQRQDEVWFHCWLRMDPYAPFGVMQG